MSLRARPLWLAATVVLAACGGRQLAVPPTSPYAGSSLDDYQAALRHYVVLGDAAALARIEERGPKDALVRALNRGLYLHRLGRYAESNEALQEAERLAEERYTKSISQNVAAFLVNDAAIDYAPPAHERAMIHYYGMLNYLALGSTEAALVEARRANLFLDRYAQDHEGRRTYANDAFVQWLAGLLHLGAGDLNAAFVSLQQADAAFRAYARHYGVDAPESFGRDFYRVARRQGALDVAERIAAAFSLGADEVPLGPSGELVVIVENGFVAHRRQEKVYLPILPRERKLLQQGDVASVLEATAVVLVRTVGWMNQASREGREAWQQYEGAVLVGAAVLDAELLTLAWPAYELDAHAVRRADVTVITRQGESLEGAPPVVEDLSAIAARDFEENKPRYLARMVARGLLKEVGVQAAGAKAEDKGGEVLGFLVKWTARAAAVLTERADTRSWSLLPGELRVARFTLPPGQHDIVLAVGEGRDRHTVELGAVTIGPGDVAVRTVFVTGAHRGDQARFRSAQRQVDYSAPRIPKD